MNPHHVPKKKLLFGCSGSGKSTKYRELMSVGGYKWVFVFDWDLKFAINTGFKAATDIDGMCRLLDAGKPVLFYARHFSPDLHEGFSLFCAFVMEQAKRLKGKKLFGCDELQECVPKNYSSLSGPVRELFNYGRNEEIDAVLTAQGLMCLNSQLKAQTTEIFIFKHSDLDESGFKKFKTIGMDPEMVKALPHPPTDGRVGWIWKHCLTGQMEVVNREIN